MFLVMNNSPCKWHSSDLVVNMLPASIARLARIKSSTEVKGIANHSCRLSNIRAACRFSCFSAWVAWLTELHCLLMRNCHWLGSKDLQEDSRCRINFGAKHYVQYVHVLVYKVGSVSMVCLNVHMCASLISQLKSPIVLIANAYSAICSVCLEIELKLLPSYTIMSCSQSLDLSGLASKLRIPDSFELSSASLSAAIISKLQISSVILLPHRNHWEQISCTCKRHQHTTREEREGEREREVIMCYDLRSSRTFEVLHMIQKLLHDRHMAGVPETVPIYTIFRYFQWGLLCNVWLLPSWLLQRQIAEEWFQSPQLCKTQGEFDVVYVCTEAEHSVDAILLHITGAVESTVRFQFATYTRTLSSQKYKESSISFVVFSVEHAHIWQLSNEGDKHDSQLSQSIPYVL